MFVYGWLVICLFVRLFASVCPSVFVWVCACVCLCVCVCDVCVCGVVFVCVFVCLLACLSHTHTNKQASKQTKEGTNEQTNNSAQAEAKEGTTHSRERALPFRAPPVAARCSSKQQAKTFSLFVGFTGFPDIYRTRFILGFAGAVASSRVSGL